MITISKKLKLTVRVISLALVLCICLSVVMTPKAHAISELVIVGAIALTLGAVAAVVILAAEPLGLKEPIMAAAQHGFQSPREFTADLLDRFGASQGIQRFVLLDRFQKGLLITTTGKVILDKAISDFLATFFDWAWSAEGGALVNFAEISGATTYDPSTIQNPIFDLTGYPAITISSFSTYTSDGKTMVELMPDGGFFRIAGNANVNRFIFSNYAESYIYAEYRNGAAVTQRTGSLVSYTYNGFTYYYNSAYNSIPVSSFKDFSPGIQTIETNDSLNVFRSKLAYIVLNATGAGDVIDPNTEDLVLPAPSMSNVLDIPSALTLPAPISGTTTATNYLEAAADAITAGTGSLEYEDANGNTQTGTLEGTGEVGLTQVGTQSAELEGAIDIADSVGSETLDNYTIDLKDFFPFCIPFDLWDMLNLLESAPAPVSVEWQFDFGQLGEYEMEINLEEWNSVAQTLRTMELLAFCFGLAMLTKRILMGS